jgi:hypothetical protein
MNCDICNTSLKTISSLNYHKKTNQKCLELQNKISTELFSNCNYCNKIFTNQILKKHLLSCKYKKIKENEENKIQNLIEEKDEEIKNLKLRIMELEIENRIYLQDREIVQKLAMQPKTSTSTNNKIKVNNFFDDPERIKQIIDEKLNKDYVSDGQKGVALFAVNTMLQDDNKNKNYICSDTSRHIFKFQNSDGNIEKDVKAMKLTNMLIDAGISSKSYTVAQSLWTDKDGKIDVNKFETYSPYIYQIATMQLDNSIFRNELACLTSS